MPLSFKNHLVKLLLQDSRFVDEQGELQGNVIKDCVNKLDEKLIETLLQDEQTREKFFLKVKEVYVFKANDFKFYLEQNSIDNSFTQYANRIGLSLNGKYLKDNTDVVLDFPYKDCILEGGQSTEEGLDTYFEYNDDVEDYVEKQSKRKEIFYNNILAKDEIDRLFEPKAFTNIKKYDKDGESIPTKFNRDKDINRSRNLPDDTITDNLLIKGNNLLALHSLKNEFKNKVKLIYIDPPYNTGSDSFKYNDKFNHSTWLTFMYNRLQTTKLLLKDNGFFCCHIDDNEGDYLKLIMDEVFGSNNYLTTLYIRVRYPDKTLKQDMDYHKEIEKVLIFRKSELANPNLIKIKTSIDKYIYYFNELSEGKEVELGGKKVIVFNKNEIEISQKEASEKGRKEIWASGSILDGNSSGRFFRDYLDGRAAYDGLGAVYKVFGVGDEIDGYRYFTGPKKKNATKGKYFQGIPASQITSEISETTTPINNFYDLAGSFGNCRNEGGVELRSGKKPEELLKLLLYHFSSLNDIILDYHLGSGTTCAVAHKMNRQYIGIEQLDYGENDASVRLKNVINGDKTGVSNSLNWKGGSSFIYMELAKNNQNAKKLIHKCKDYKELVKLFDTLYSKYFLHYNVRINEFKNKISKEENFKKLSLDRQKEIFCRMLDNNQLYVHAGEMEDKQFGLSKEDIRLTKDFYQL